MPAAPSVKFETRAADGVEMDMAMAGFGALMNALVLAMIVAGVLKLFQIHSTLGEIKDQLAKPSYIPVAAPQAPAYPTYSAPQSYSAPAAAAAVAPVVGDTRSGEQMLRELDAQMMLEEARQRGGLNPR